MPADDTIRMFTVDLNFVRFNAPPGRRILPAQAHDWAMVDPQEYVDWHLDFGSNAIFCHAYTFGGFAYYPTILGPVAPGPGARLLPRMFDIAKKRGVPFWSYFSVNQDLTVTMLRPNLTVPRTGKTYPAEGLLAPETEWTDLLVARVREFLAEYPVDWLLFDAFGYGSLRPDEFPVQPAWFVREPFAEIVGRPMPEKAEEITPEEGLAYKREVLARQFVRIRDAVRTTSPGTRIVFNTPYWEAHEKIWDGHPVMNESDMLFSESSRDEVVDWLLEVRKTGQRVMTTVIGRPEKGETMPETWRKWHERGCDFFGYAWGNPPDFRPHAVYADDLAVVRKAFAEIARGGR